MFLSNINNVDDWSPFLNHRIWHESMRWLLEHASAANFGTYPLGDDGWFANVHQYHTKEESLCVWESHQHTIDIQFLMSGKERILWSPISQLQGPTKTLDYCDRQEWHALDSENLCISSLDLSPGFFVIFLPNEGHCPMISIKDPELIKKTVVKIPITLLSSV